jgi:RNase P/RNase MRP subunit POP5
MVKPTQRFKQRYVAFSLSCNGAAPTYADAKEIVHSHFLSMFGEIGVASLAFKLVKYDQKSGEGIIRCERGKVDEVIFTIALLSEWKGAAARMEPKTTSGTIKRL